MAVVFTDADFEKEVLQNKGVALVDFWAPWCGPCQVLGPIVEELAKDYGEKAKVGKLNVDDNPKTAATYGVMSIPTLIIFKGGKVMEQLVGLQSKEEIKKKLDAVLEEN